ncbi:MAG: glutamyl-tRNA synthetase [Actinomycetia bacterium]|jgi:glutamyl-tRNA synthetase|nr:glutamyl-tRNA synthetase [Actinomycetes bacterium]MDQ1460770.1 glutamyl-tRNA synthetase [Actinomycetota bacterium]
MTDVRLRFSPAPTGFLHIGSVRTALYNWLHARHVGGTFILRIEDTDVARSTQESVDQIQQVMRWMGLDWDEGPFLQSARFDTYLAAAQRMVDEGLAYECFCTESEVKERNEAAMKAGRPPGYDGHCRNLSADERAVLVAEGRQASIRFRTPDEGRSTFTDLIRGEVSVEWSTISDFVIVRSNGTPVFFLANAVDDLDMGITHVLRGEDLIDSTHRVLALRRALGHDDQPVYAHMPLILGPGGGKLSKRHGAVSVEEYRDAGYLSAALLNYLALLGWGPEDGREILSIDELVREFELERVNTSGATFDPKKLEWMNGEHIRAMPLPELVSAVLPFARSRYGDRLEIPRFEAAVQLAQVRSTTLVHIAEQMEFLFTADDELEIDPASWEKLTKVERVTDILDAVIAFVATCAWTREIDPRPAIEALGIKPGKVMHVLYTAIEGRSQGLPVFDSIGLLGRDSALTRLRAVRDRL